MVVVFPAATRRGNGHDLGVDSASALDPGTPRVVGSAYVNAFGVIEPFCHSFQWGP
jgi:hypothetical protein